MALKSVDPVNYTDYWQTLRAGGVGVNLPPTFLSTILGATLIISIVKTLGALRYKSGSAG